MANEHIAGSGMLWVNADGLHMSGCTSNGVLRITQRSQRSTRPNLITGCGFTLPAEGGMLTDNGVTAPISFHDSVFRGISGHTLSGNILSFTRCEFIGGNNQQPALFSPQQISIQASRIEDGLMTLAGLHDIELSNIQLNNCVLDFSAISITDNSTLIFCQNRLRNTTLVSFPAMGKNVISDQNITIG